MKTMILSVVSAFAVSTVVLGPAVMAAEPNTSGAPRTGEPTKDAQTACMDMMQGSGMPEEGKKAMQEFMQSPKGAQAMTNMMEMARRMGNGDPMLGMTKMMEMMGGQGGRMGSHTGPETHRPK